MAGNEGEASASCESSSTKRSMMQMVSLSLSHLFLSLSASLSAGGRRRLKFKGRSTVASCGSSDSSPVSLPPSPQACIGGWMLLLPKAFNRVLSVKGRKNALWGFGQAEKLFILLPTIVD